MGRIVESWPGNVCVMCIKTRESGWFGIGENRQNDEIILLSKISKVYDKNVLEKSVKITILIIVRGYDSLHRKFYQWRKHK